jgi:hypothetical protein
MIVRARPLPPLAMDVSPDGDTLYFAGALQAWDPGADGVFGAFGAAITSGRVASGGAHPGLRRRPPGGRAAHRRRLAS